MKLHQLYTSINKMEICILLLRAFLPPCPLSPALENETCMSFCMLLGHKARLVGGHQSLRLAQAQGVRAHLDLWKSRAAVATAYLSRR